MFGLRLDFRGDSEALDEASPDKKSPLFSPLEMRSVCGEESVTSATRNMTAPAARHESIVLAAITDYPNGTKITSKRRKRSLEPKKRVGFATDPTAEVQNTASAGPRPLYRAVLHKLRRGNTTKPLSVTRQMGLSDATD